MVCPITQGDHKLVTQVSAVHIGTTELSVVCFTLRHKNCI